MWFLYSEEDLKVDQKDQSSWRKNIEVNTAKIKEDLNTAQSQGLSLEDFKEKPYFWQS